MSLIAEANNVMAEAAREIERLRASNAALVKAGKRMIDEADAYDDRPLEPTCNECTQGQTPINFDRGPCAYHEMAAAIARATGAGT